MPSLVCELCDFKCCKPIDMTRHVKTKKHIGRSNFTPKTFDCNLCAFTSSKQSAYNAHINTRKHIHRVKTNTASSIDDNETITHDVPSQSVVDSGIAEFTRTCPDYMGIINQLLSQNNELKNFIIEQASEHKKDTVDIMNKVIEQANEHKKDTIDMVTRVIELSKPSITTNNNNNKFNINVFLSEQCKDAINFSDFIKNIEVSRQDIQNTGQLGFVDGISKIIMDNLKQLGVNERPIHCTDLKRETMYIKDEDKWNKEENDSKLRSAIQTVSRKSIKTLQDWKEVNPDYENGDSDFSTECLSMQRHSVAGDDREVYFPKVAKLVAKEVIIDKNVV